MITVARSCSLLFIVLDVLKPLGDKAVIENELEGFGIRLVSRDGQRRSAQAHQANTYRGISFSEQETTQYRKYFLSNTYNHRQVEF